MRFFLPPGVFSLLPGLHGSWTGALLTPIAGITIIISEIYITKTAFMIIIIL